MKLLKKRIKTTNKNIKHKIQTLFMAPIALLAPSNPAATDVLACIA
jgi:hypothetical protein